MIIICPKEHIINDKDCDIDLGEKEIRCYCEICKIYYCHKFKDLELVYEYKEDK